jgi:hypothetical protein
VGEEQEERGDPNANMQREKESTPPAKKECNYSIVLYFSILSLTNYRLKNINI